MSKTPIFSPFKPTYEFPNKFDNSKIPSSINKLNKSSSLKNLKSQPIIDMTIDIGQNDNRKLLIYENDEPKELAIKFCEDNDLNMKCVGLICSEIEKNIKNYWKKRGGIKLKNWLTSREFKEGDISSENENKRGSSARFERKSSVKRKKNRGKSEKFEKNQTDFIVKNRL